MFTQKKALEDITLSEENMESLELIISPKKEVKKQIHDLSLYKLALLSIKVLIDKGYNINELADEISDTNTVIDAAKIRLKRRDDYGKKAING